MSFDNADRRIRGRRGVELRSAFLAHNPICVECDRSGRIRQAEEVDHITPLYAGGLDRDENKQALCVECHKAKTAREQASSAAVQLFPDWLEPAACQLCIVYGPPGSGKTTYVEAHASATDLVIDLDVIKASISGLPIYQAGEAWIAPALRERNRQLGALKRETRRTWFITTGTGKADRAWWERSLKPSSVVLLDVPEGECIDRIRRDKRRTKDMMTLHIKIVRDWWAAERGMNVKTARKVEVGPDGWPLP